MLIDDIFREFINVVQENQRYVIGLLDQKGNVTSCSNEKWLHQTFDPKQSDQNNIYHEINVHGSFYGYFWVNGNDENLKMISNLLVESLNVRLTYEITHNTLNQKVTQEDELIKLLLDETHFDRDRILVLINDIGLDQNKTRVAIYITSPEGFNTKEVMKLKLQPESEKIIYSLLDQHTLILFKEVNDHLTNEEFEQSIRKYIQSLERIEIHGSNYYVGSLQKKLRNYQISYQNCCWSHKNLIPSSKITFFTNQLFDYFISKIHLDDVNNIFDYYKDCSKGIDIDELITIATELFNNDFNITQTAEILFLHKNTLIYKLKKYEETFNIELRSSYKGKILFLLIAEALKEVKKRKQVGDNV